MNDIDRKKFLDIIDREISNYIRDKKLEGELDKDFLLEVEREIENIKEEKKTEIRKIFVLVNPTMDSAIQISSTELNFLNGYISGLERSLSIIKDKIEHKNSNTFFEIDCNNH